MGVLQHVPAAPKSRVLVSNVQAFRAAGEEAIVV